VGERGLEREQQQWRAAEELEASILAGQGELLFMVGHMTSLFVLLDGDQISENCRTKENE
jgi:hypothetical protein